MQSNKFPSQEKYLKGMDKLSKIEHETRKNLNLVSGNCGSFAIALKKFFGKGKLIAFYSEGNVMYLPGFSHVLLEVENKLYDGIGIHTINEELKELGEDEELKLITDEEYIEKMIPKYTAYFDPPKTFEKILKEIFIEEK